MSTRNRSWLRMRIALPAGPLDPRTGAVLLAFCTFLPLLPHDALGQSTREFTKGDAVFLTSPGKLRVGDKTVMNMDERSVGIRLHVFELDGPWLWVRLEESGWIHRRHVAHVDQAVSAFTSVIAKEPQNHRAFYGRANAKSYLGDLDSAIKDAQQAERLAPDEIAPYCLEADLWLVKGDWDNVIAASSKAIASAEGRTDVWKPSLASAHYKRGFGAHMKGDLEAAEQDYTQSLELHPQGVVALCRRGIVRRGSGRLDEAIKDFSDALEIESKYAPARCDRGLAHQLRSDYSSAEEDFRKTIATFPDRVFSPQSRSDAVYARIDRKPESIALLNPERSALYNLVRLKACCNAAGVRDGRVAVEFANRLRGLDKGRYFEFVAIEAAAHAEAGDFDQAQRLQREAIDLAPDEQKNKLGLTLREYAAGRPLRVDLALSK